MGSLLFRIFILIVYGIQYSYAHIIHGESGWMHPLSGIDHMIAMIAVGAWSAELGGSAIFKVPMAFVFAMFIGGLIGFTRINLPWTEEGIALSVLLLGLAIAMVHRISILPAVIGVTIFGICHGYAHGYEIPDMANKYIYAIGFLVTTACLHIFGAIGGLLILENKNGKMWLRLCGVCATIVGVFLLAKSFNI